MTIRFYDKKGNKLSLACETAAEAVRVLKQIKSAEIAREDDGTLIARRYHRDVKRSLQSFTQNGAIGGQLSFADRLDRAEGLDDIPSPLPRLVKGPATRRARRAKGAS